MCKQPTFKRAGEFHERTHEHLRRLPANAITGDHRPLSVIVSRRGDPLIPVNGANQLVAKFSRLYAEADPEDQFVLRVWMRDIILSRKEGSVNMLHARRSEKRMIEACERRILEFPVGMDAREVAKELKREGWYAWATEYQSIILRIERVRAKGRAARP
jgi:hypothetical protein